jgi:hypothetical protein
MRYIGLFLAVLMFSGCADKKAYDAYLKAFNEASKVDKEEASKPLVDISLPAPPDANGKAQQPYKIIVNKERRTTYPAQIKDSEWTGTVIAGLGFFGLVADRSIGYLSRRSDNDASVAMNRSNNEAQTDQLRAYVGNFSKEITVITEAGGEAGGVVESGGLPSYYYNSVTNTNTDNSITDSYNQNTATTSTPTTTTNNSVNNSYNPYYPVNNSVNSSNNPTTTP